MYKTVDSIKDQDTQDLFVGLFLTGGRATELLSLYSSQIISKSELDERVAVVRGMQVLKQRKRVVVTDENGDPVNKRMRVRSPMNPNQYGWALSEKPQTRSIPVEARRTFTIRKYLDKEGKKNIHSGRSLKKGLIVWVVIICFFQ